MHDLVIIGAGPAGLAAALYAGRFKMDTLLVEKTALGGQILYSQSIENYPGFPGGISTFELIDKFKKQVDELGVRIDDKEALEVIPSGGNYSVRTAKASLESKTVIISSGAQAKRLNVQGEDKFTGRGVSYCGTCDGPLFKNKEVVVVGGGDRALEDALFLSAYASSVRLVHRRSEFRASGILVEKAGKTPKISFILDSTVEEIFGGNYVEGIRVKNLKTGRLDTISCAGVFIFVGITPNTGFVKKNLDTDESGFIITDSAMRTSSGGVFAAGDCCKKSLYQVISACSDGAVAADSAHKYLLGK